MTMQGWGVKTIAGLGMFAGWFLACAGDDIPPIDDELRGALLTNFGGETQMAVAGSAGSGTGGRGGSGSGTSGSSNAGSSNAGSSNAGGGAAGSGGEPVGGGGSDGANVCNAYETIFVTKCDTPQCHGDGSINGAFAGTAPPEAGDLVNNVSSRGEGCGVLVDPVDTDQSLILTMVNGEADPGACFPVLMPLGDDDLPPEEIDCIADWLTQFAE